MKKLVLVDLDGTLFNTNDVNYYAYMEALKIYNYTIDYDYYCKYCNGRKYSEFLLSIVKSKGEMEEIHNIKKELYSQFLDKAKINTHLINILRNLKNEYFIAVVTTASKKNTTEILKHYGIFDLFDDIVTQEDITYPKPNPEGFIKVMKQYNIESSDTIIFEDSIVGIEAAKATNASVFVVDSF